MSAVPLYVIAGHFFIIISAASLLPYSAQRFPRPLCRTIISRALQGYEDADGDYEDADGNSQGYEDADGDSLKPLMYMNPVISGQWCIIISAASLLQYSAQRSPRPFCRTFLFRAPRSP